MAMTNTQHLINSIQRATQENLKVINSPSGFIVINQEGDTGYVVEVADGEILNCNCPHHANRGVVCKHMVTASLVKGLNIQQLNQTRAVAIVMVG